MGRGGRGSSMGSLPVLGDTGETAVLVGFVDARESLQWMKGRIDEPSRRQANDGVSMSPLMGVVNE